MASIAALLAALLLNSSASARNDTYATQTAGVEAPADSPPANTTDWPRTRVIGGLETFWELPPEEPQGVLFVAHGCNHQGSDFWPPSPQCQQCLGLPEELLVRQTALKRGYALIAVSSYDRERKCWHNTQADRSEDLQRLPTALRTVIDEEGLDDVPLLVFGASSGGGIVQRLVQVMSEIQGVIAEITPVALDLLDPSSGRAFPPTVFVSMAPHGAEYPEAVTEALKYCRIHDIPAAEIRVRPHPVTPDFLQRSPQISAKVARAVVRALSDAKLLDEDGYLLDDPRENGDPWRAAVQPVVGDLSLVADASQVSQLLNVAYAKHELVGEPVGLALAWLEGRGDTSMQDLEQQLAEAAAAAGMDAASVTAGGSEQDM